MPLRQTLYLAPFPHIIMSVMAHMCASSQLSHLYTRTERQGIHVETHSRMCTELHTHICDTHLQAHGHHSTHLGGTACSKNSHEEGVLLHTGWTMSAPAESQLISALIKVLSLLTGHRTYTPTLGLDPGPLRSCRWAGPEPLKGLVWLVIRNGDSAEEL